MEENLNMPKDADDMVESKRITELPQTDHILNGDYMLVSNPLQETIFRSYKMEYELISSDIKNTISCLPDTVLSGKWKITGRITIPTKRIDESNPKSVVNCDWLSVHFLRQLDELSSEIYVKNRMQSFIGQVIYSTTLKTEEQVKKKYGDYTSWEKIEGRFIMSTTDSDLLEKTTGDFATSLTIHDVPKHSHGKTCQNNNTPYKLNWSIPMTVNSVCLCGEQSTGNEVSSGDGAWTVWENRDIKLDVLYTSSSEGARACGWADGRVAVAYGNSESHGKGTAKILPNNGANQPHNNIPPFYTVHIWKRTK